MAGLWGTGKQQWGQWGGTWPSAPTAGTESPALPDRSLPSRLPLPGSTGRAGGTQGSQVQSPELVGLSLSLWGVPSAEGHILGLPTGLTQLEQPVLRLAMAHGDEVVELWQSPERGGEGWHQLVAYPGRIAEQFQVRQDRVSTWTPPRDLRPEEPCDAAEARDTREALADAELVPSVASCRQLIFSLTQAPACGAELALDDIVFRNCGLQGEFLIAGMRCEPGFPGKLVWALKPGERCCCPLCLGCTCLARAQGG